MCILPELSHPLLDFRCHSLGVAILGAILISGDSAVNNVKLFLISIGKDARKFPIMLFRAKIIHKMRMQIVNCLIDPKVTNIIAGRLTVNQHSCINRIPQINQTTLKRAFYRCRLILIGLFGLSAGSLNLSQALINRLTDSF